MGRRKGEGAEGQREGGEGKRKIGSGKRCRVSGKGKGNGKGKRKEGMGEGKRVWIWNRGKWGRVRGKGREDVEEKIRQGRAGRCGGGREGLKVKATWLGKEPVWGVCLQTTA